MSTNIKQEQYLIDSYSRKQAIADGVLVDAEERFPGILKSTGFRYPVALTAAAFGRYVELNSNSSSLESEKGRMRDILSMLSLKIALTQKNRSDSILHFSFLCTVPTGFSPLTFETLPDSKEDEEDDDLEGENLDDIIKRFNSRPKLCRLKAVVAPGDELEPCITIMLPGEID